MALKKAKEHFCAACGTRFESLCSNAKFCIPCGTQRKNSKSAFCRQWHLCKICMNKMESAATGTVCLKCKESLKKPKLSEPEIVKPTTGRRKKKKSLSQIMAECESAGFGNSYGKYMLYLQKMEGKGN